MMPWPSDRITEEDASTETGRRVLLPAEAFPANFVDAPYDPSYVQRQDGFSR